MSKLVQTLVLGLAAVILPWAVQNAAAQVYSAAQLVMVDKVNQDLINDKTKIAETCGFPAIDPTDITILFEASVNANATGSLMDDNYRVDWTTDGNGNMTLAWMSPVSQVLNGGFSAVLAFSGKSQANLYCRGNGIAQYQTVTGDGNKTPTQVAVVIFRGPCLAESDQQVADRFDLTDADSIQGYHASLDVVDICARPPETTKWCSYDLPDGDIFKCETVAFDQVGNSVILGNSSGFTSGGSNVLSSCDCIDSATNQCGTFDPTATPDFCR